MKNISLPIFSALLIVVVITAYKNPMREQPLESIARNNTERIVVAVAPTDTIKTGADQTEKYVPYLKGKRVAMLANQTSIIGRRHLVDSLQSLGVNIVKVFGPEHGFRGNASAGTEVADEKDMATGIPIISLYGKKNKPVLLMKRSILTEKIARRGLHLVREYRVDPFALTRVSEVMTTNVETVPSTMTLHGAAAFLTAPETRHPSFPVIDGDRHVLGLIDPPQILRWRRRGMHRNTTLGELLAGAKITLAYPDEYLEALADKLQTVNVSHLPVVSREDSRLVGYVGWKDLMRVRSKTRAEERDRARFVHVAGRNVPRRGQ